MSRRWETLIRERSQNIVFRTHQAVQPGLSTRREILVRPQEPTEPTATAPYLDFARLLVDAYQYMGGEKLSRHIDAVGGDYSSVDKRIEGVLATLYAALPAAALSVRSPRHGPAATEPEEVPPAEALAPAANTALAGIIDWQEDVTPPESVPPPSAVPTAIYPETLPREALPTAPPPFGPQPSATPRASASPLGASNRAKKGAPPLRTAAAPRPAAWSRPESAETSPPYTVSSLLDQLYAGPEDPGFESALQFLWTGKFPDRPADRAVARRLIAERAWYIPVLLEYDRTHLDETLEAIFRFVVIPDLGRPEVAEELARWADEWAAPSPVIKALDAAAQSRADAPELLRQALEPPLGRRWLAEHGIYTGPSVYAAAASAPRRQAAHAEGGPRSQWALLDGRFRGNPVTLLALFCAVLIALLVLSLVH